MIKETDNKQDERQEERVDALLDQLEAAGKRSTPQRQAICQALIEHGGHPTVADIFERVRFMFPMISQATVYNTIDTLRELGLIHQLDIANHDHTHYDLDTTPHINVVCRHCEYIADVKLDTLDSLLNDVSKHTGCRIDHHAGFVVYGICPKCLAEGKGNSQNPNGEVFPDCKGRRANRRQRRHGQHRACRRIVSDEDVL